MKDKILFLYLKTGGGHLAPARAVAEWIAENEPNRAEVKLCDGFESAPIFLKRIVEDGYRKSQASFKWVFELLYLINKLKPFAWLSSLLVGAFVSRSLRKLIETEKPTKIVVFHFFLIKPIHSIVRRKGLTIPILTVVTDPFTAHPIWFLERNQQFVVFSQNLKNYLVSSKRITPESISVFPFIISQRFDQQISSERLEQVYQCLNVESGSEIILLLGGADGIPKGEKLLQNLAKANFNSYVVLVCGRNEQLYAKAQRIKQELYFERLRILGYVDYVRELLYISEVVVTKCGASTFMEVLYSKKIPLVNSFIWEQEKGNVDFVCDNNLGLYEPSPKKLIQLVGRIIEKRPLGQWFKSNIERLSIENGTPMVSTFILNKL
jgi:processive 1,2-diacylglycerol beta-glucosyltransferase/1,2-diacylglycerol 3-beta-galactosyltransferase